MFKANSKWTGDGLGFVVIYKLLQAIKKKNSKQTTNCMS